MTVNREYITTYYNASLGCGSTIDYFLVSDSTGTYVSSCDVLDPDCNLSDHRPIVVCCKLGSAYGDSAAVSYSNNAQTSMSVSQLRWDYGDIALYQELTGPQLQSLLDGLMQIERQPNVNV